MCRIGIAQIGGLLARAAVATSAVRADSDHRCRLEELTIRLKLLVSTAEKSAGARTFAARRYLRMKNQAICGTAR
jgi:hypothetical protein